MQFLYCIHDDTVLIGCTLKVKLWPGDIIVAI